MALIFICRILVTVAIISTSDNAYQLFSIGTQLELEGEVREAIRYYKQAKEVDPSAPEIYNALTNALYKIRKFDEGIQYAQEGLTITSDSVQFYLLIGTGYISKGDLTRGITYYEKVLARTPANLEVYGALSMLYEGNGDIAHAIAVLERVPDDMKTSETYIRLGSLSGKQNNHERAIDYYRKAYAMDTTNTTALVGIGTGFDYLLASDSAIYYYETVRMRDTSNVWVAKRLIELYADVDQYEKLIFLGKEVIARDYADAHTRRNMGFAYYKLGMVHDALSEFLIASQFDPADTYSRFYTGRIYLEQGEYDRARTVITDAITINPSFIELWIYLGFITMDQKDFKSAEYAFTEAAYRGGDLVQIYYLLGIIAEMQEHDEDAYVYYRKSLKHDPQNLASLEALAHLCDRIGRTDEALQNFENMLALDTTNAVVLNYVGYTYAEHGDSLEYALDLINRALAIEENNGYYIDSRGWVYFQMGKYEEALTDLKRASELLEDVVIFEHLGDVYMELDNTFKARESYEKALELDPDNKILKKKLSEIQGN
jgi:tetratricopeptide (TPR) repeat protein